MTQTMRELPKNDVDERIARFLAAEEEKYKAERKEKMKAVLQPLGFVVAPFALAGAAFMVYAPIMNFSPAQETASVVEEWAVSHPTHEIPTTDEFVSYPSYLGTLGIDVASAEHEEAVIFSDPDDVMVKVINNDGTETSDGYTICAYLNNDGSDDLYSFDSTTGKAIGNALKVCS